MDLQIRDQLFCVTGASSGLGRAIAYGLAKEGAQVIINARRREPLENIQKELGGQVEILEGDITTDKVIADLFRIVAGRKLSGVVINAGGPPAMSFLESELEDWDRAYEQILRWKVKITKEVLDAMLPQHYGRIIYIESVSVKQPVEDLVLSNAYRLGGVGFVKTLAHEVADRGVTLNVMAPGYHDTPAMERLFIKKSMLLGISIDEARVIFENEILTGKMGDPADFASLALWLLSPLSSYVTGQTISVDGGLVKGIMG